MSRRPLASARAFKALRQQARAYFIVQSAAEADVRIAILGRADDPCVFVWARTAPTPERRRACETSFRHAIYRNLRTVALLAAEPRGRA
jgi:hypothetical protein